MLPERCSLFHIALQGTLEAGTGVRQRVRLIEHREAVAADEAGFKKRLINPVPRNENHRAAAQNGDHAGHRPLMGVEHFGLAQQHRQFR
ncbi:hypothetical protein D3C79_927370 [compost metagenome]